MAYYRLEEANPELYKKDKYMIETESDYIPSWGCIATIIEHIDKYFHIEGFNFE